MKSPFTRLFHKPPDYTSLRTFGSACFPWQKPLASDKLSPRAPLCIFLGYSPSHKGYKCLNILTGKIIISRHVTFDETYFPTLPQAPTTHLSPFPLPPTLCSPTPTLTPQQFSPPTSPTTLPSLHPSPISFSPNSSTTDPQDNISSTPHQPPNSPMPSSPHPLTPPPPAPLNQHPMTTRLKAGITKPKQQLNLTHSISSQPDPTSYSQAVRHECWRNAMSAEFLALQQQATWCLVPPPTDQTILGCRWTFKTKLHADGSVARHKARLVAQGFNQELGVNFHETFSPVAKIQTIRMLLTLAATKAWPVHQFDISNAFLHGILDDTVYMKQPPGFVDTQHPGHVCLLRKALYGLKQAPRTWFSTFVTHLKTIGFTPSTADPTLFINRTQATPLFLLIYVDDILLTGGNPSQISDIRSNLQTRFSMKDLGLISTFLGIQVIHTTDGYFIHQTPYLLDILHSAGFQDSKPVSTPTTSKTSSPADPDQPFDQPTLYRRITGSLQYLTLTRPDIQFAVNYACQFMHNPTVQHFHLLKRILRYLHGTPSLGLQIKAGPLELTAYSDSDWAGDQLTRRSTTGYCIYLGYTLIAWKVHKQSTVARSTTEAEYRALAMATTEVLWLRRLLTELGTNSNNPTTILCDNTSALAIANNPIFHARTKHIEIDFQFIRDHISNKDIQVHHVTTQDQVADVFTKHHSTKRFQYLRNKLNVGSPPVSFEGG